MTTGLQTANDPATVAAVPGHGSNLTSSKEAKKMNSTNDTTAARTGASNERRPGHQHRDRVSYAVANLAALFTVCALALNEAEEWDDDIRKRVTQDIKHVLELGALITEDVSLLADELEDE